MKYIVILLTTISALTSSCNQVSKTNFIEEVKGDTLFHYDENKVTRLKVPLVGGLRNGEAYTYDAKGKLSTIATYVKDTIQGGVWEYYPSGILKSEATYFNGKKFGNYAEFFDGYQDSTAVLINGQWRIAAYSTKLKLFEFYDLREKAMYSRKYNINGKLLQCKGRVFQAMVNKAIQARKGNEFSQGWITPDPSHYRQLKLKQFVIISNLTDPTIPRDTVYPKSDSTVTRWSSKIQSSGEYKYQAVAFILENGNIETDTSNFKVIVQE